MWRRSLSLAAARRALTLRSSSSFSSSSSSSSSFPASLLLRTFSRSAPERTPGAVSTTPPARGSVSSTAGNKPPSPSHRPSKLSHPSFSSPIAVPKALQSSTSTSSTTPSAPPPPSSSASPKVLASNSSVAAPGRPNTLNTHQIAAAATTIRLRGQPRANQNFAHSAPNAAASAAAAATSAPSATSPTAAASAAPANTSALGHNWTRKRSASSASASSSSASSSSSPPTPPSLTSSLLTGVMNQFLRRTELPLAQAPVELRTITPPDAEAVPVARLSSALRPIVAHEGPVSLLELPEDGPLADVKRFPPRVVHPDEVDWTQVAPFVTSSRDPALMRLAEEHNAQFVSSTSSTTPVLSQLHHTLTRHMPIRTRQLSHWFLSMPRSHTRAALKPSCSVLRRRGPDLWGVDNFPSGSPRSNQILIDLGKSLELQLTLEPERFTQDILLPRDAATNAPLPSTRTPVSPETHKEAFHYVLFNSLLLRSQIDCEDPTLGEKAGANASGSKVFDLKTRATLPIRLDISNYRDYVGYRLVRKQGLYSSFEREWYDMARSSFLKYALQCRIGNMAGIFVAYHNTQEMFGYEYISLATMDETLYGSTDLATKCYQQMLRLLEAVLQRTVDDIATPDTTSLRLTVKAGAQLTVFVETLPPARDDAHLAELLADPHNGSLYVDAMTEDQLRTALAARGLSTDGSRPLLCARLEDAVAAPDSKYPLPAQTVLQEGIEAGRIHRYDLRLDLLVNGAPAADLGGFRAGDRLDVRYRFERSADEPARSARLYRQALEEWQLRDDEAEQQQESPQLDEKGAPMTLRQQRVREILKDHEKFEEFYARDQAERAARAAAAAAAAAEAAAKGTDEGTVVGAGVAAGGEMPPAEPVLPFRTRFAKPQAHYHK